MTRRTQLLRLFIILQYVVTDARLPEIDLALPPSHTALGGDLHLQILASSFPPLLLQLSRLDEPSERATTTTTLTTFPVLPEARNLALNATLVRIPCGYFSRGGQYYVLVKKQPVGNGSYSDTRAEKVDAEDEVLLRTLDVRWPMPKLTMTPEQVQTYPERPVNAILEFPDVECPPMSATPASAIPEFWLELHYCGHSLLTCDEQDSAFEKKQVLYSEQVRGFPGRRVVSLRCELFGLAGYYSLALRPTEPTPALPRTAAYVKADWSEQYVFNVHARSIFPCDQHAGGVTVLFQYPACILTEGDRVRLYAKLRANVASLSPPTTLEYIAEQRVVRGAHSLRFDCELFSERYVEYCFVYVSQSINGAVADVRMDCVPTLPVSEVESGGWGPWSEWTSCSSTCLGGTRSRYRFCDSPPPRYGAKFCQGERFETERCGFSLGAGWECFYTTASNNGGSSALGGLMAGSVGGVSESASSSMADAPEVVAEVGPYCRCGCVVHLGVTKPRRLLATSSHSCPGRVLWEIQADEYHIVQIKVEQFRFPCGVQWLKIRDGDSLYDNLLNDLADPSATPAIINSTGSKMLLEFYSDDVASDNQFCGGGFLAYAIQAGTDRNGTYVIGAHVTSPSAIGGVLPLVALKLTAVHLAAIFFLSGLIIATVLLGAQYMVRYRKYHNVAHGDDQDSLADTAGSCSDLPLTVRATSNVTLLSEVISLQRLRPGKARRHKHTRLRESVNCDEFEDNSIASAMTVTDDITAETSRSVTLAKQEESLSISSTSTLTPEDDSHSTSELPLRHELREEGLDAGQSDVEEDTSSRDMVSRSTTSSQLIAEDEQRRLKRSSTIVSSEKDRSTEKENGAGCVQLYVRRPSNASVANLTNVSILHHHHQQHQPSPKQLQHHHQPPLPLSPLSTHTHNHTATYRIHARSESGAYSPALSTTSTATIRSTNLKENKDKRNRERLLAGPVGSEFSLVGPDVDLELDYYDYNVVNAGAAPGSYLGMDPAFLVWIPPLDESGEILDESGAIISQHVYIDPKSNTESPEEEDLLLPGGNASDVESSSVKNFDSKKFRELVSDCLNDEESHRLLDNRVNTELVSIQMHEFPRDKSVSRGVSQDGEKETKVEKSPQASESHHNHHHSSLDDIKFADDEESGSESHNPVVADKRDNGGNSGDRAAAYQDSNILSSS